MDKSKRFRLNWEDVKKILKGAGIVGAGAGLTYLAENMGVIDFGEYNIFISGILMIGINFMRKILAGEK